MAQLFRKSSIERLSSPEQLDKAIIVTSPMSWVALIGVAVIIISFIVWAFCGSIPVTIDAKGVVSNGIYTNSIYAEYSGYIDSINVSVGDTVKKGDVLCTVVDNNGTAHEIYISEPSVVSNINVQEGGYVNYSDELFGISPVSDNDGYVVFFVDYEKQPALASGMEVIVNLFGFDNQKYGHMSGKIVLIDKVAASEAIISRICGNNQDIIDNLSLMNGPVAVVTCKLDKADNSKSGYLWSGENGKELSVNVGSVADVKVVVEENKPITKLIPGFEK